MKFVSFLFVSLHFFARGEGLFVEAFWLGEDRFRAEICGDVERAFLRERVEPNFGLTESRFFNKGDILWEVTKHFECLGIEDEERWFVYNETTGYLIVKAPLADLSLLKWRFSVENEPLNLRYSVEIFEVADVYGEWVDWNSRWDEVQKELLFEVQANGLNEEATKQIARWGKNSNYSLELQSWVGSHKLLHFIYLAFKFSHNGEEFSLESGLSVADQSPYFLELGKGERKDVTFIARIVPEVHLVGGPAYANWHQFEAVESELFSVKGLTGWARLERNEDYSVSCLRVPTDFSDMLCSRNKEMDPFATDKEPVLVLSDPVSKTKVGGKTLDVYFPREDWKDVKEVFFESGVEFKEEDFAYFGRVKSILVVRTEDEEALDVITQILSLLDSYEPLDNFQACFTIIRKEAERSEVIAKSVLPIRGGEWVKSSWRNESFQWELEAQPQFDASSRIAVLSLASSFEGTMKSDLTTRVGCCFGEPNEFLLSRTSKESYFLRAELVQLGGDTYRER